MKIITDYTELTKRVQEVANRMSLDTEDIKSKEQNIKNILSAIKKHSLSAVQKYTKQFDNIEITPENIWQSTTNKFQSMESHEQEAIKLSVKRIKAFNQACMPENITHTNNNNTNDQISIIHRPLDSVGVYIPGGTAPLLSTVIMTVVLAQVAGVERIIVTSPPETHSAVLAVCDYLGIEQVLQLGGVQAIGALAYGIPEINLKPVDKIIGPGNIFVTLAKKIVYGQVGIDALYGPSELIIIADETASPKQIAHDLIGQLEHGSGLEATGLFTTSKELAEQALQELNILVQKQPRKEKILQAWNEYGILGVVKNIEQACELSNIFAPEHLELKLQNSEDYIKHIKHAGAIFLNNSNEAFGDYLAGASHCLPTGRSARFSSGLSVHDFLKRTSVTKLHPTQELIEATAILARMEGLEAHAQSAESVG